MSSRVLLTGATGLLGHWVRQLWPSDGPELLALGSADRDLLAAGAAEALVAELRPTHVVHLAWSAGGSPGYREDPANERWITASLELARSAASVGATLWLTGTPVDGLDDAPDLYARSKTALRRAVEVDVASGAIGWLRPTYVVDPTVGRPAIVAAAQQARRHVAPVELLRPTARHDFIHAADVGSAVVLAVTHGRTGWLPIGSGRLRSVAELATAVGARWEHAPAAGAVATGHSDQAADVSWLSALGWRPTRTEELFADV